MSAIKGGRSQTSDDNSDNYDGGDPFGPHADPIPLILPAGGISLLAGAAGVGKTAMLATLLRDLAAGRPIFGHQPNPVPGVGIICADRSWRRGVGDWFARAGCEVAYHSLMDDDSFDPRRLRRKYDRTYFLAELIDKLKLPPRSLVAVDPIGMFLGGNLIDYDTVMLACVELRRLLRQRLLTILGTAHTAKLKANKKDRYLRLQDQILGSAALFGFGDTQMYLAAPDELAKPYYAFHWHPHLAPPQTFPLERDEAGLFSLYEGADKKSCDRLLTCFPENGDPLTFRELVDRAQALPLSQKTVQRALQTLIDQEKVIRPRHGLYRRVVLH